MTVRSGFSFVLAVLVLAAARPVHGEPTSTIKRAAHVGMQAFADRDSIGPGESINLAVVLNIDKDWHIYWRSPGGVTGMPTRIEWSGPPGVKFGPVQFPAPESKYDNELKETSFINEGTCTYVVTATIPVDAKVGDEAVFKVQADWLVCKKECIPGGAEVSLSVPIVAKAASHKPVNAEVFERASAEFPISANRARHVKLSGTMEPAELKPGGKATAVLLLSIAPNHHMQSHKPLQQELIAADVFVEQIEGIEIGEVEYPAQQIRQDDVLGKLSEYNGEVRIKINLVADEKLDLTPRWLRGVFRSQICNDTGTCFSPQNIEFSIPIRIAGGASPVDPTSAAQHPESPANVHAAGDSGAPSENILVRAQTWLLSMGYVGAILVALIGGFALNLMPCVLPVISLKVLSFVRQAHEHRARVFWLGMTYCAGILTFFSAIGVVYWATNQKLQWGEQFQRPHVNIALAAVVTAFALSLFGVFVVFTPRVINKLGEKAEGEGLLSAYSTGLLATLLGTACTAPFLSAAIGAASKFSAPQGAMIFCAVGFGMALPFMLLAANPAWLRFVPKPGPWMLNFEHAMGFLLLGTVVWLLNPLKGQIGAEGVLLTLIFLIAVAIASWIKGKIQFGASVRRKLVLYCSIVSVLVVGWIVPFRVLGTVAGLVDEQIRRDEQIAECQALRQVGMNARDVATHELDWSRGIPWQKYKRDRVFTDVRSGKTVFIDYTADWCANCKTMLKTAIERPETIAAMRELGVIPYTADYTLPRPEITEDLKRFERGGVPVFVVYRPGDTQKPEILPEIITSQTLIDALRRAGPSKTQATAMR
jgi:thiol:disulfide interchange protein DsbD